MAKKSMRPTTGSPREGQMKDKKIHNHDQVVRFTRPILPNDINGLPNVAFRMGRTNPKGINYIVEFGKQTFEGKVAYAPLQQYTKTRFGALLDRNIVKRLGGASKG